jgi:hypothetical protein
MTCSAWCRRRFVDGIVRAQFAGWEVFATAEDTPPHKLAGLRVLALAGRISDPRVANPPVHTTGSVPDNAAKAAAWAFTELGMAGLVLAGAGTGGPWVLAIGWADLDRGTALTSGHRFPAYGGSSLVAATAVTVRELLSHTAGADNPPELFADEVPPITDLYGPVVGCGGMRGKVRPSNGGFGVLGQIVADVTGMPFPAAVSRLVLRPLGMTSSSFPARAQDIAPDAVTGYEVDPDGRFVQVPAKVCTLPAAGGLWAAPGDVLRLATGWSSLLPPELSREALKPQTGHMGLGWLLTSGGATAVHGADAPAAHAAHGATAVHAGAAAGCRSAAIAPTSSSPPD